MLTPVLAHHAPLTADGVWASWNVDPLVIGALVASACLYARGRAALRKRRGRDLGPFWFSLGLAAAAVAVLSPLDRLAASLASAHMVQHVLLVLVAAPLLALSAPAATLLKGTPLALRRAGARALPHGALRSVSALGYASAVWLLHVAAVWVWHAALPYEAALRHSSLHALEHATFFVTAVLFWMVIAGAGRRAISHGYRLLLVFTMGMQSVFLAMLMTFAPTPWYPTYASTTSAFGLDALADQQLAGAIMWVPAGLVYVVAAAAVPAVWLADVEAASLGPPGDAASTTGVARPARTGNDARTG